MLPQYKKNTNIGIGISLVAQIAGLALAKNGMGGIVLVLLIAGFVSFIWGCGQYAKAKGYSAWFGALGLFSIIGLVVLVLFPDKHKDA